MATTLRQGELSHRWPHVLPGGKAVLFTIWNDIGWEPARVAVQPLDGSERRMLIEGGGYGRYVPTGPDGAGHLVYARAEGLMAAPFSLERLEVTGPSVPVLEGVITNLSGGAHFSVSSNGTLAYLPGTMGEVERTLVWVDRQGGAQPLATIRGMSLTFRLSPDGTRLVRINSEGPSQDIWIHDLLRGASSRVTFGKDIQNAMWTPDGTRVTYGSGLPTRNLFWKRADGTGPEERLTTSPNNQFASS